ncbi:MAG TPA: Maf family protein [Caldisericia bacterium]|nr:Maf family protein [Caldisericia bacterium]HPB33348.1 Maf family protein [Caldisericia bacterium]HQL67039.1 Maf family protein [Caldisericia bacterium]HQN48155.1 Maf family protein [Caldisericia bacterium]HQO99695.1 Maf family protein [Caldisericia bacterium]
MKSVNLPGRITLSSNSKRRYDILSKFFIVDKIAPEVEEINSSDFEKMAIENSKRKVLYAIDKNPVFPVVSGDTFVIFEDKIFGKPKNREEAFYMLKELSNNWHLVYSGFYFTLQNKKSYEGVTIAKVKFKDLSDEMIENYIKTDEPMDKAGSYAIHGEGRFLIEKFEGCFYTIVGFPVVKFIKKLKEAIIENS